MQRLSHRTQFITVAIGMDFLTFSVLQAGQAGGMNMNQNFVGTGEAVTCGRMETAQ
jgi:hypothetical protein